VIRIFIAYFLIIVWVGLTGFTSNEIVRQIRPLIFAIAVLFWSLPLLTNPLSLAFTTTRVNTVIIANKTGTPLVAVDMISGEEAETTLLMGMLSAIKSSMESVVGDTNLKSILFQDSLLFFIQGEFALLVFVLTGNISNNLELLGRYYLEYFETKYHSELSSDISAVYPDIYEAEIEGIKKIMNEVYLLKD
jgi:hypothetical protein